MPVFSSARPTVLSREEEADLSKAALNPKLSAVDFDEDGQFFYMTVDRAMFTEPVATIRTVLEAHGFVANLENVLSCLDSFRFGAYTRLKGSPEKGVPSPVEDYLPCLTFELPKRNRIGPILKSFYDEIACYDTKAAKAKRDDWQKDAERSKLRKLTAEKERLEKENEELKAQVAELSHQLSQEQRSLNRASKALDSQQVLPANAKLGRIESIDLKRRKAKVKCRRQVVEIPTHLLDRVPAYQARCLVTFDERQDEPLGSVFFDDTELADLEKRTAELLFVEGKTFKARDSMRTEFQIKAVNPVEAETISRLKRGDQVLISIADGYVARFHPIESKNPTGLMVSIAEQFVLHDIEKNPLRAKPKDEPQAV